MNPASVVGIVIAMLVIVTILASLRICNEWERKVVLRLGRFGGVRGPGIFFLLPYIEQTPFTIDTRVVTTPFQAEQTLTWGIKVQSVQLRDIKVPDNLQDALSRMAQAERERQARVILGESEVQVAQQFSQAGELYRLHPTALHLRGMNMLYETMRSGVATVIVVPSSALESMNLGAIGGVSALGQMAGDGQDSQKAAASPPATR